MTIKIYTIFGELVVTLEETNGDGQIVWDSKNNDGNEVASGVYLCLITNDQGEKKTLKSAVIR